jgi:hypothetical protein
MTKQSKNRRRKLKRLWFSTKKSMGWDSKGAPRWVYVFDAGFRDGDEGVFKIGISFNLKARELELKSGNPYGKILFAGFARRAREIEKQLHRFYQNRQIDREMFSLTKPDLLYIRQELQKASEDWYKSWA